MLPKKSILIAIVVVLTAMLALPGCSSRETTSIGWTPERLAEVGVQIDEAPDKYRDILNYYDLSSSEFEQAIREVTENQSMARRYTRRFKKLKKRYRSQN